MLGKMIRLSLCAISIRNEWAKFKIALLTHVCTEACQVSPTKISGKKSLTMKTEI